MRQSVIPFRNFGSWQQSMDLHRAKEYSLKYREAALRGFFYCEIINKVCRFLNPKTGDPLAEVRGRSSCICLYCISERHQGCRIMISDFINFLTDFQHPVIQLADHGGTLLQFLVDRSCLFLISFIAKMMIKISPVIHGSCPKL